MKKNYPLIIISGPSGAGEDSIIDGLKKELSIERVITTTTRDKRPGESQGHPYYFISQKRFEEGIDGGRFFEYAKEYNNNYYGVTFEEIERVLDSGKIGIWKIEYKGVMLAKKMMPEVKAIFVIAPLEVLEKRIRKRAGATDEYVEERMAYTRKWLNYSSLYDYVVVNEEGKLDQAIEEVKKIIIRETGLDKIDNK